MQNVLDLPCPSAAVGKTFDSLFSEHRTTRIIVATFASNVDRVQQIINTAYRYRQKGSSGRPQYGQYHFHCQLSWAICNIPEDTLIEIDQVKNYPDEKAVLITTGSQGESMAALSRMAASIHKKITIKPNDTIIFSSNPIPGNEKAVSKVINELSMQRCEGYLPGCPCIRTCLPGRNQADLFTGQTEICNPGTWRVPSSDMAQKALLRRIMGIPKENIFILAFR